MLILKDNGGGWKMGTRLLGNGKMDVGRKHTLHFFGIS